MRTDRFLPRGSAGRVAFALTVTLFLVWTGYWLVQGVQGILADTSFGRGELGASLDAHELLEIVFIGSHYAVRWFLGAAPLAAVLLWTPGRRFLTGIRRRRSGPVHST